MYQGATVGSMRRTQPYVLSSFTEVENEERSNSPKLISVSAVHHVEIPSGSRHDLIQGQISRNPLDQLNSSTDEIRVSTLI